MKSPEEWIEKELLELISLQQEETLQLEFKRAESLDKADKKKTEISKDVSAFANSVGGTIIYGLAESTQSPHFAQALSPVDPISFPKEWLEQIINSLIQPRIPGIAINSVGLGTTHPGKCAHVVSIPQGTTAHQASDFRYYRRYNFESVPMLDYEIRQTMDRASRPVYSIKLEAGEISGRDGLRTFKLHSIVENVSELVGQDVSVVVFVPKHIISRPDTYEVTIEGGQYSRIPGMRSAPGGDMRFSWTHPPLTPYRVVFGSELNFSLKPLSALPLKVLVRVYDKFGLALTTRVLLSIPDLNTVSPQELPSPASDRRFNILTF
jgi:schlafen family protein